MKKSLLFLLLLVGYMCSAQLPTIYQFSQFSEIQKVNGSYTPTVIIDVQYGLEQALDSALWNLGIWEVVGVGHNFSNGGVVINSIPIGVGLSVTPSANGISYGAGMDYDAWNNNFFPVVNLSFTINKVTNLLAARATASPKKKRGFRVVF